MVRIKKNNFAYKNIYQCITPGCPNVDDETNVTGALFYIISENGLNQKPLMEFLQNTPIRPKVSRICSEHFTDDCFQYVHGIKMLKPNAVPTIKRYAAASPDEGYTTETGNIIEMPPSPVVPKPINNNKNIQTIIHVRELPSHDKELDVYQRSTVIKDNTNKEVIKNTIPVNGQIKKLVEINGQQKQLLISQPKKFLTNNGIPMKNKLNEYKNPPKILNNDLKKKRIVARSNSPMIEKLIEPLSTDVHQLSLQKPLSQLSKVQPISSQVISHTKPVSAPTSQALCREVIQLSLQNSLTPPLNTSKLKQNQIVVQTPPNDICQLSLNKSVSPSLNTTTQLPQKNFGKVKVINTQILPRLFAVDNILESKSTQTKSVSKVRKSTENIIVEKQTIATPTNSNDIEIPNTVIKSNFKAQNIIKHDLNIQNNETIVIEESDDSLNELQKVNNQSSNTCPRSRQKFKQNITTGYINFESCKNNFSFYCNFCKVNIDDIKEYAAHLIRFHNNEIENKINTIINNNERLTQEESILEFEIKSKACGYIAIPSEFYNTTNINSLLKLTCNFCQKTCQNIIEFSEHIGSKHLDMLHKDGPSEVDLEDDIDIDPSCILIFDDEDDKIDLTTSTTKPIKENYSDSNNNNNNNRNSSNKEIEIGDKITNNSSNNNNNNNNNNKNKVLMTVPMTDKTEILMEIDIDEYEKSLSNKTKLPTKIPKNTNKKRKSSSGNILEAPKLKVNIKYSSWATKIYDTKKK